MYYYQSLTLGNAVKDSVTISGHLNLLLFFFKANFYRFVVHPHTPLIQIKVNIVPAEWSFITSAKLLSPDKVQKQR